VRPVLLDLGGVELGSYGVSKLLAALAAGFLLARELGRRELDSGLAYPLTLAGGVGGFVGAKLYYLAEHADSLAAHDFGGSGFTWFGGLLGGGVAVLLVARAQEGHGHQQPPVLERGGEIAGSMTEMQHGAKRAIEPAITAATTEPPKKRLLSTTTGGRREPAGQVSSGLRARAARAARCDR